MPTSLTKLLLHTYSHKPFYLIRLFIRWLARICIFQDRIAIFREFSYFTLVTDESRVSLSLSAERGSDEFCYFRVAVLFMMIKNLSLSLSCTSMQKATSVAASNSAVSGYVYAA